MSARDQVIDHLADNIDAGPAKTLAIRAGAQRRNFPVGDIDARGLWASLIKQLDDVHGPQAFERLFEVLAKEYPRTVEESRAMLEATPEVAAAGRRPSTRARRIRVYDGDDEVWWINRAGEVAIEVWVSAKARGESAPQLVVAGEGPSDTLAISEAVLDDKAEWWIYEVTLSRAGPLRRDLQFRVADNAKTKQSLTIVSPWLWFSAGAALLLASLVCIAIYLETFPRIPGAGWSAIIGALPAVPLVVGAVSLAPPMAKLRSLFLYPARLVLAAVLLLVLAVVPGLFLVAVENGTTQEIRIGKSIAPDDWIVVTPSTFDEEGAQLCRTQPTRSVGLDLFLPRSVVTAVPSTWRVIDKGFDPKTILKAAGGLVRGGNVVLPCDRLSGVVPTAEVKHRDVSIHVPYLWAVSVVSGSSERVLRLEPPLGGSDTLPETEVLSSAGGTLRCSGSGPFLIEQVISEVAARSVSFESSNEHSSSKWLGITTAWRCRFPATTTSVVINLVGATNTLDLVLPAELGVVTLQFGPAVKAVIQPANRFLHLRPVQTPSELQGQTIPIEDGEIGIVSGLAILSKSKSGVTADSFKAGKKSYALSVNSDGSLKIGIVAMPRGACTYFIADKDTQHRGPPPQMRCDKYPENTDHKDAKIIVSGELKKGFACTDVYICQN